MTTYRVPSSVQKCAQRALDLHRSGTAPLEGVAGVSVAEALVSGEVSVDTLSKLHRFFSANRARYVAEMQMMRDERSGPTTRSWVLHGGEAAERWAGKQYHDAVAQGLVEEDPLVALFKRQPEEVYTAFQAGAWRYEFELDPSKAARFVEEYTRSTGWPLELTKAFGESAKAVGQALYRRMHTPDPFRVAMAALKEPVLKVAAMEDIKALGGNDNYRRIEEALAKNVWSTLPARAAAKLLWPPFVAYFILAVESPEKLKGLNGNSLRPPKPLTTPKPYMKYHDAINTFNTYFNFDGARYVDPDGTNYEDIEDELFDLLMRSWKGQPVKKAITKLTLQKAYKWLKDNKLATGLFNVTMAAWMSKDWPKILDMIPVDHDVYAPFKEFAGADTPTGAASTTTNKESGKPEPEVQGAGADKPKDDFALAKEAFTKDLGADAWVITGPATSKLSAAVSAKGKKLGKGTEFWIAKIGEKLTYFATASDTEIDTDFHAFRAENGELRVIGDAYAAKAVENGDWSLETTKTQDSPSPDDTVSTPKLSTDDEEADSGADTGEVLSEFIKKEFGDLGAFKFVALPDTLTYAQIKSMYDASIESGSLLVNVTTEDYFEVLKAFTLSKMVTDTDGESIMPDTTVLFLKDDEGAILYQADDAIQNAVTIGKVKPVSAEDLEDIAELRDKPFDKSMDEYVAGWLGDTPAYGDEWEQIDLHETQFFTAALNNGGKSKQGELWVKTNEYTPDYQMMYKLLGAVKTNLGKIVIFFEQKGPSLTENTWSEDGKAAEVVEGGAFMPLDLWESHVGKKKYQPKFAGGTIITNGEHYWFIAGDTGDWYDEPKYVRVDLEIELGSSPTPMLIDAESVDSAPDMMVDKANPTILQVYEKTKHLDGNYFKDVLPDNLKFKLGDVIEGTAIGKGQVVGFLAAGSGAVAEGLLVVAVNETDAKTGLTYPRFYTTAIQPFLTAPSSSYAPTDVKPEAGSEDGDLGATPALDDMCGTQEAIDWVEGPPVKGKPDGIELTTKALNPKFQLHLGERRQHSNGKWTVTIIGYGKIPPKGNFPEKLVYLLMRETGKVGWKTLEKTPQDYVDLLGVDQDVVNALKPLPGAAPPAYSKLNYSLGKEAKAIAQKNASIIYQPSESDALYKVGTWLRHVPSGNIYRLVGWVKFLPSDQDGMPLAPILYPKGDKSGTFVKETPAGFTEQMYTINYQHKTAVEQGGAVTFGKASDDIKVTVNTDDYTLPSELPYGHESPQPIEQSAFKALPPGKHVAAGVVAIVPAYAMVSTSKDPKKVTTQHPMIVLVRPFNDFAGYTLTFPKGTVDKGEGLTKTAVREFWEETGLAAKPVAHLGDYVGKNSTTRFFMGYLLGGDPTKAGNETDAVVFKPLPVFGVIEGYHKSLSWYAELLDRDKKVVDDAVAWMQSKGALPQMAPPDYADVDVQPSSESDTVSMGAKPPTKAKTSKQVIVNPGVGANAFEPDALGYYVGSNKATELESIHDAVGANKWAYLDEMRLVTEGYPAIGQWVKVSGGYVEPGVTMRVFTYTLSPLIGADLGDPSKPVPVRVRVALYDPSTNNVYQVALKDIDETGKVGQTFAQPSNFVTVKKPSDYDLDAEKPEPVPATVDDDAFWDDFVLSSKVPINAQMLAGAKKGIKSHEMTFPPSSWSTLYDSGLPGADSVKFGDYIFSENLGMGGIYSGRLRWDSETYHFVYWTDGTVGPHYSLANKEIFDGGDFAKKANPYAEAISPWYVHPNAKTNSSIEFSAKHSTVKHVTLSEAKKQFKEAGVPYTSYMMKNDILPIAKLFLYGVPKGVHDAVIQGLKARADLKKKGKKAAQPSIDTVSNDSFLASTAAPVVKEQPLSIDGPQYSNYLDNPSPMLFKDTGKGVSGGSKPNKLLTGPGGAKWFFKTGVSDDEKFRAHIDKAAYQLAGLVKENNVPVTVMEFQGQTGSLQPYAEDAQPVPGDPTDLDQDGMAEVLTQHVVDMFMGDHDGHAGNWLKIGNKLRRIDLGQAFKFLFQKKPESFAPNWQAPGNFGTGYAKKLLVEWGKGSVDLGEAVFIGMRTAIGKIQQISNAQLKAILAPVFEAKGSSDAEQKRILTALQKRRDAYLDDWTTVMVDLRKDFKWPGMQFATTKKNVFQSSPQDVKITAKEAKVIADVNELGWQGKALQIDRDAIEQQNVMIRRVNMTEKGLAMPGTLIHFRVSVPAGVPAVRNLLQRAKVTVKTGGDVGGPQPLAADAMGGFWSKILTAIKSINYHLVKQKDLDINKQSVDAALAIKGQLEQIKADTDDPKGTYKPTGESNLAVHTMADQYLMYLSFIDFVMQKPEDHLDKHSEMFDQFTWQPPKEEQKKETPQDDFPLKVELRQQGATMPNSNPDQKGGPPSLKDVSKPTYDSGKNPQFVIIDENTGAKVFFAPPTGSTNVTVQGKTVSKSGIKGYHGIAWGVIPGEPNSGTVAHLLKMFEAATGIGMSPATPMDNEIMYYAQQATILQNGGKFTPNSDGTAPVEAPLQAALSKYNSGKDAEALAELKEIVAKKLKVPVDKLEQQPGFSLEGDYTRGGGFKRQKRLGWTREKIIQALGKNVFPTHRTLNQSLLSFFQSIRANGALISNNIKPFYGVQISGSSWQADFSHGGTQGLFGVFRKLGTAGSDVLHFDPSILLRMDVYVVGTGDSYGDVNTVRIFDPEKWGQWAKSGASGGIGASSNYQINFRHEIDIQEYLYQAIVSSTSERDQIRAICKEMGWTKFAQGRSIEQVIVSK